MFKSREKLSQISYEANEVNKTIELNPMNSEREINIGGLNLLEPAKSLCFH